MQILLQLCSNSVLASKLNFQGISRTLFSVNFTDCSAQKQHLLFIWVLMNKSLLILVFLVILVTHELNNMRPQRHISHTDIIRNDRWPVHYSVFEWQVTKIFTSDPVDLIRRCRNPDLHTLWPYSKVFVAVVSSFKPILRVLGVELQSAAVCIWNRRGV